MTTTRRRLAIHLLLAAAATIVVLESVVTIAWGSGAPGWSHWLCSPATLRSAVHTVGGSGFGATLLTALKVHWPHFLPILVGLATLVYLWRANAQHRSQDRHVGVMGRVPRQANAGGAGHDLPGT